ncbi:NIPSNAP family protein [Blastopirellula marina]|uniref:NIPSNAP family protein n=1 Tax=Blastopirellula marina TaxID=124 RepID=A0A2S8F665_9BACT|nr:MULTISPECIES: NIPSNAP family protein [Pirellulaceae]PQO27641.1 NIPSNAP family protein [Blastopirellula marina]RCS48179.1 NIPSNAP family protein [Bremerella cremea]
MMRAMHLSVGLAGLLVGMALVSAADAQQRVYELRTYTTNEGKLENLHARFRDHTMELFEKQGMQNHIYWVPTEGEGADNTLVYIISHENRDAAKKSWQGFLSDPDWKKVAAESEKDGKILAKKPDAVYMEPTDFSPQNFESADEPRLFELRKYTTAEGRLPALLQRFRDGELKLFEKQGMTNVAYFTPVEMPNTLIYVVAHKDAAAMKKAWDGFRNDQEWQQLWEQSTKDGKIVIKVDRQVLRPVDYSPMK